MSNRARRRWLLERRIDALLQAGIEPPPETAVTTVCAWNQWVRAAYRALQRRPLRAPCNLSGEAGALQEIQYRNQARGLGLLHEWFPEIPPDSAGGSNARRVRQQIEAAEEAFYRAREGLASRRRVPRLKFDWGAWEGSYLRVCPVSGHCVFDRDAVNHFVCEIDDFPAVIYRGLCALERSIDSVVVHADRGRYGEIVAAARAVSLWAVPTLSDADVLRLVALIEAHRLRGEFLAQYHRLTLDADGFSIDDFFLASDSLADVQSWFEGAERIDSEIRAAKARAKAERSAAGKNAREGRKNVASIAIKAWAKELRKEFPDRSKRHLFDIAVGRAEGGSEDDEELTVEVNGEPYLVRVDRTKRGKGGKDDPRLVSFQKETGKRDGVPVGFDGWKDWSELNK